MGKVTLNLSGLVLLAALGPSAGGPAPCAAQSRYPANQALQANRGSWNPTAESKPSLTGSLSSGFKQGLDKLTAAITPKTPVKSADDPVSLQSAGRPSAELYVAVARMYEQSGRLGEAEKQYWKALKSTPNYLGALLGYARVKDLLGEPEAAKKIYLQAAKTHPKEAPVYNNLGLFYARRGRLQEAVAALRRAIQLQPQQAKYRNNLATVLVELGQRRAAYGELRVVYGEPVAYYNLGYLLEKKGQLQTAAQHYEIALRLDPSLVQARHRVERLARSAARARLPQARPDPGPRVGSRPVPQAASRATPPSQPGAQKAIAFPPARGAAHPAVRQLPPAPKGPAYRPVQPQPPVTGMQPGGTAPSRRNLTASRPIPPAAPGRANGAATAPLPAGPLQRPASPTAPLPPQASGGPSVQRLPRVR